MATSSFGELADGRHSVLVSEMSALIACKSHFFVAIPFVGRGMITAYVLKSNMVRAFRTAVASCNWDECVEVDICGDSVSFNVDAVVKYWEATSDQSLPACPF